MKISKNRIFIKIFKTMFLAIMFFTTVFTIYSISNQKAEILKSLNLEAKSIAKMLIHISSDAIVLDDGSYLVEFNYEFLSEHELLKSVIISKSDKKYYQIKKDGWTFEDKIEEVFIKQEKNKASSRIMYSPVLEEEVFHYVYPIEFSGTKWGYLHLSLSLDKYHEKINNMYLDFLSFFIVLIVVTIFMSYIIARNFSKPIINLNKIANRISQGNLEHRSDYRSNDEIGELSSSFNKMISKIQHSQKELEESHEELENRVKDRTLALYEANKELEEKSNELKELNKKLDLKVKEELNKRSKQETLLIQQSRLAAMGEMIGNIAHQWRQPLSIITTAASGMKLEKEVGVSIEKLEIERLSSIINTANYLSSTIDDFSNFFKPNKNKVDFLISDKVEQSLELVYASLNFHHIQVRKEMSAKNRVYGFPNECSQAIMNILSNAKDVLVQRSIENPEILIRTYDKDNCGVLEIEDNAGGINLNIKDKIFDPYFTTKHQSQGTGIGLYMSKMIIEQNMDGTLEVYNSKKGAVFKISIPTIKHNV